MSDRIDLTRFIALADKMAAAHDEMGLEGMGIHHAEAHSALLEAIAELKRCYELIDSAQGDVPYVEHCEECGATDGGDAEGCDYCGIIHYESNPRGFYHKDSPKR